MTANSLYDGAPAGAGRNALIEQEHPVIEAARQVGVDPYQLLQSRDLRSVLDAAMRANPQFMTDSGMQIMREFSDSFKRHHNMTSRDLPGAPPPGQMPNALYGPGGRPRPLLRPFDEDGSGDYSLYERDYNRSYGVLGGSHPPSNLGILGR